MNRFIFGAVFDRFFKLFGENAGLFCIIGLIGNVVPILAASSCLDAYLHLLPNGWAGRFQNMTTQSFWIIVPVSIGVGAVNLIALSMITETAILRAVGKEANLGKIFIHGLTNILPLFAQYIQVGLTVGLGFILLVIPGIFWAICTWVAVPAYVGQPGLGISGAYTKSFELTRGHRWSLLLIGLVLIIVKYIAVSGLSRLLLWLGLPDMTRHLIMAGYAALATLIDNVFTVAIYVTLREGKDRLSPANAAEVFS